MRGLALPVVVAAAFLGAAGCGGDDSDPEPGAEGGSDTAAAPEPPPTVNAGRVERAVKKELDGIELFALPVPVYPPGGGPPEQTEVGGGKLKVRSVTCPPDVPLERGGTFTCELEGGEQDGTVRLKQLNSKGTSLSYQASITASDAGEGLPTETELKGKIRVR